MPPRTRLPQELIDKIVVELAGDWRSLEALVTLDLDVRFIGAHARLREAFISNAHLGGYVKLLHLRTSDGMASPDILLMMPQLRTLDITGAGRHSLTSWSSIPAQIQTDILGICLLPTLIQLRVQKVVEFPLAILKKCPQLRDLQIPDGIQDTSELSSDLSLPDDQLRNSHVLPGYLESLTAFSYVPSSMHLDLSRLKNLRRVRFSTARESLPRSVEWGCRVLETIPEDNHVETVFFTLAGPPVSDDIGDVDPAIWGRIDNLLTQKRYSALRHVVVNSARYYFDFQIDRMLDQIVEAMPKLGEKGLIQDLRVYINKKWA
ncbi:hypothetical protein DXG03_001855 [Asterophora parasitica]|uniref:F-box domain-containing protein n=1 Tax=Asterophora parasitica TaxID=117018 RepID=A0A9P7G3J7_9AGAR|nr:hypothetical protein DXG03_001855 [Asterophora parasitica]